MLQTVLIFGRSPFMKQINIAELLGFTTVGINYVDNIPFNYVAYCDKLKPADLKINPSSVILTHPKNKAREPVEYYKYFGWRFTHDFVLSWLIYKAKNVVLIGCADFDGDKHYNTADLFKPSEKNIQRSIEAIENYYSKYYNLYTLNPKSRLKIPRITIEDLYADRLQKI